MSGVLGLGVALIVMTVMLSSCAQMQSMGLTDPLISMLTGQLNVSADQAQGGVGSMLEPGKGEAERYGFQCAYQADPRRG